MTGMRGQTLAEEQLLRNGFDMHRSLSAYRRWWIAHKRKRTACPGRCCNRRLVRQHTIETIRRGCAARRLFLFWCRAWDSNPHRFYPTGF